MKIDTFQAELLVRWLQHHITAEQRHQLMRDLPAAYNGMCGYQVVEVVVKGERAASADPEADPDADLRQLRGLMAAEGWIDDGDVLEMAGKVAALHGQIVAGRDGR